MKHGRKVGTPGVRIKVANPARPSNAADIRCLVDSGALYSVIPSPVLKRLGIRPTSKRTFTLADGTEKYRSIGGAIFSLKEDAGYANVVFGEKGDATLLGGTALESMGLAFDPIRRTLRPLPFLVV